MLGLAGPRNAHPAIVWTGSEFLIAHFVEASPGQHVALRRAAPGREPGEPEQITPTPVARSSLSLAHSALGTAIGWVEGTGAAGQLHAETLSGTTGYGGMHGPVSVQEDYDDAHVLWHGERLVGAFRTLSGSDEALNWVHFRSGPAEIGGIDGPRQLYGELSVAETTFGPLLISGRQTVLFIRDATDFSWSTAVDPDFAGTGEGDAAELPDGSLLAVFGSDVAEGRVLESLRLEPGPPGRWTQAGAPVPLGWYGTDVVAVTVGSRVFFAWADTTMGAMPRPLALAMLDDRGVVCPTCVPRCPIAAVGPSANEPDVACGGGYCAIVWTEGTEAANDNITRFMQLRVSTTFDCPST
jgi:hypothetical protein